MKNPYKLFSLLFIIIVLASGSEYQYSAPAWTSNATIYELNVRQFSDDGSFNAVISQLPRLKAMGVKIIWLMPIHPIGEINRKGTLGSYYSVKDYKAINPEFGTARDFESLVSAIHAQGMYVIIDWVANHTAWDNAWIKDHPEYYTHDESGRIVAPVPDWTDVADLNYDNPGLREAMWDALEFWVRNFDIDGYRCDVAAMVPDDFWLEARKRLDAIKPVFMLAEASEPEMHHCGFDMTYGWQYKDIMVKINKGEASLDSLYEEYEKENIQYGDDAYRMIFTTNHDENSWHGTVFSRYGKYAEMFVAWQCVAPGMPLVYSGQEAGMNKQLDFFEKDPIVWQEHKFGNIFTTLLNLKLKNPALWNGQYAGKTTLLNHDGNKNVLAFVRENGNNRVLVFLNSNDSEMNIKTKEAIKGNYKDVLTGKIYKFNRKNQSVNLPAYGYLILTN